MIVLQRYKSRVLSFVLTTFISLHCFTSIRCSDDYTKEIEKQNEINNTKNDIDDIINDIKNKHTWAIFEITIEIEGNDFPRLKEDFNKKGLKIFMSKSYRIDDDNLYEGTTSKKTKAYMLKNKEDAVELANSIKKNEDKKKVKEGEKINENKEIVKIPFYILVEDISTYNIDANQYAVNAKSKNHVKTLDNYCDGKGFTYSIKIFAADTSDVTDISFIFL